MKRMLFILALAICEYVFAADVIERVTVLRSDDPRGIANEKYDKQLKATSSAAPISAGRGDQLVLHAGKSGQYVITVSGARRSNFGNAIVRGKTPTGGRRCSLYAHWVHHRQLLRIRWKGDGLH